MISKIFEKLFLIKTTLAQTSIGGSGGSGGTSIGGSGGSGDAVPLPNPLGKNSSIEGVLNDIATWLVTMASFIVPIVIIIGAFYILFAGGDPEKMKTGRKAILYAVIGFIIIISAKGIMAIVEATLVKE